MRRWLMLASALLVAVPAMAQQDSGQKRLMAEFDKLETTPCRTDLVLQKLPFVGWHVTCDKCGAVAADRLYPKAVIDLAERWSVNGKISFTELLRLTGECPR